MTLNEYQLKAMDTAIYKDKVSIPNIVYAVLGLTGESGEVADKIKKIIRDNNSVIDIDKRIELAKELGDVLWYLANLADDLGFTLNEIAGLNIDKTKGRKERNTIHGDGDNR